MPAYFQESITRGQAREMASPAPLSGFRPVMVELMACLQHGTPTFVMSRSDNDFECSERVGVVFTTQSRPTFC